MSGLIEKFKKKTKEGIYAGQHKELIEHNISHSDEFTKLSFEDQKAIRKVIQDTIETHNSYKFIQRVMNSKILLFQDTGDVLGFDEINRKSFKIQLEFLNKIIKSDMLKDLFVNVYSGYNPHKNLLMYEENGSQYFNVYTPPMWKEAHFFDGAEVEPSALPDIYKDFFSLLVENDEQNYNYLLSWIAHSLKSRNMTTLVTLGAQGSGKGVLGGILKELHGSQNYSYADGKKITSDFNAFLNDVTMVYFDEIEIKDTEQENSFKMLANDEILIQKKQKDHVRKKNYANIYMSSNNLSSIRVSSDDRRYSIINITNKKLYDQPGWNDVDAKLVELYKPENIALLARYLWHYEYDKTKLTRKFESKRSVEIKQAAITDWEDYFINVYCVKNEGKTILLNVVKSELREQLNNSAMLKINANSFKNLIDKIKALCPTNDWVFQLARPVQEDKTQPVVIKIQELRFQPKNITKNFERED